VGVGVAPCVLVGVLVGVSVFVGVGVFGCVLVGVGVLAEGVFVEVAVGDGGGAPGNKDPGLLGFTRTQLTISQKLYAIYLINFNYFQIL
jgi:hypothetical protein